MLNRAVKVGSQQEKQPYSGAGLDMSEAQESKWQGFGVKEQGRQKEHVETEGPVGSEAVKQVTGIRGLLGGKRWPWEWRSSGAS